MRTKSFLLCGALVAVAAGITFARQIPVILTKVTSDATIAGVPQWTVYAIQIPGEPALSAQLSSADSVTVSWPASATNYRLILATNTAQTAWLTPSEKIQDDGTNKSVIVTPQAGIYYYKLEINK